MLLFQLIKGIFLIFSLGFITGIGGTWFNPIVKVSAAVISAFGIPGLVNFGIRSKFIRSWRLKRILQQNSPEQLFDQSEPFILHENFSKDLSQQILLRTGGVRILWGPTNSGKSTTLVKVLNNLCKEGKISGVFIMEPPTFQKRSTNPPETWFSSRLTDRFGEILAPHEKLSSLLPRFSGVFKPYVIVIDQAEKEGFDKYIKEWVVNMAVESTKTKAFVVLLVTADAIQAHAMQNWNGRQKITLVGADHGNFGYRWSEKEVDAWLDAYLKNNGSNSNTNNSRDDHQFSCEKTAEVLSAFQVLRQAALTAGTPGFLSYNAEILCNKPTNNFLAAISPQAIFFEKQWNDGAKLLSSLYL